MRAALIPFEVVKEKAVFVKHLMAGSSFSSDSVWGLAGVKDITERLRQVQH